MQHFFCSRQNHIRKAKLNKRIAVYKEKKTLLNIMSKAVHPIKRYINASFIHSFIHNKSHDILILRNLQKNWKNNYNYNKFNNTILLWYYCIK